VLLERAAARLGVSAGDLQVADGTVRAAGRRTSFWQCADDASFDCESTRRGIEITTRLPGSRQAAPRYDLPDKIAGRPASSRT